MQASCDGKKSAMDSRESCIVRFLVSPVFSIYRMSGWNHKPHYERGGLFLSPGKYPLVMADFDGHHDGIKDSQQVSEKHFWLCLWDFSRDEHHVAEGW